MIQKNLACLLFTCALVAGCSSPLKNDTEQVVLGEAQIKKALSKAKMPQQFGFNLYPLANGDLALSGSARLHPRHMAVATFETDGAPVIKMMKSTRSQTMHALIDTAAAESWFNFNTAMDFGATFLGMDDRFIAYQGSMDTGQIAAFAAVIPQMRIDQLFIENAPVYVRMATGPLGSIGRGIIDPQIDATLGYDILSTFEYIQFDLEQGTAVFSATDAYTPNEELLVGQAEILVDIPHVGLAVLGAIDGADAPILLDLAGRYSFATSDASVNTTAQVELGEVVYRNTRTIQANTVDGLPRAGIDMLKKFTVTVCPRIGLVYFEKPIR